MKFTVAFTVFLSLAVADARRLKGGKAGKASKAGKGGKATTPGVTSTPMAAGVCNNFVPNPMRGVDQLLFNAGIDYDQSELHPIGSITALIPEAADAAIFGAPVVDGESGDIAFPHGHLKPLATVGEVSVCDDSYGEMIVGVPDGLGVYLSDDDTVRAVVQSESYGPLTYESYPYHVNGGAASFTGSHVQYVDYDRELLEDFMDEDYPASNMVKGMGELITKAYNLKGELVGPRNHSGPTTVGAHYSNTDASGNYVVAATPSRADWLMQSLCSAHLEVKHQWGAGIGLEDTLFITPEEWMELVPDVESYVGLSAHVVDVENHVDYAIGSMTVGGFEKIVEINSLHTDYVIFAISGYNGNFGSYDKIIEKRNAVYGNRADGKPWVQPQDIVPARIYIGIKGKMEDGTDAPAHDFLARNGLRYGQMYGFATDMSGTGPTNGLYRDAFHKSDHAVNGATVPGVFTPINWKWDGVVRDFEHDGSWDFQEQPPLHAGTSNYFWNANGMDAAGCKTEHVSPDPRLGISGYIQGSTCGYFGHYYLNNIKTLLDGLTGLNLPGDISATYYMYEGEKDITARVMLGGKGQHSSYYTNGADATKNWDSISGTGKVTFEDIDGIELIEGTDGKIYAIIQEDSGSKLGERMFITSPLTHDGTPVTYYFVAMSGGSNNTRMMAGVGIPKGVAGSASAHEFSGIADISGLLARNGGGDYVVGADDQGYHKRAAERSVHINDKLILLGLQSHNYYSGVIAKYQGDRGGQWLAYQPNIPN